MRGISMIFIDLKYGENGGGSTPKRSIKRLFSIWLLFIQIIIGLYTYSLVKSGELPHIWCLCNIMHNHYTMTSSNGNILRAAGPFCACVYSNWGARSPVDSPHNGQWRGALVFSLICAWTNGLANNRNAGEWRRNCVHHDVTVMRR